MKIKLVVGNGVLGAVVLQAGGPKVERSNDAAAFARLKTLVGEWEADTRMGKAHLSYELMAGGTALGEKESAEKRPAMLTVYHLDGQRLLLTHYCMAGDSARMEARGVNTATGRVEMRVLRAPHL